MIAFADPLWLLSLLPWSVWWWRFARRERRAVDWVETRVAPRRRALLTRHDRRSLARHLWSILLVGVLLALAAARPVWPRGGEATAIDGRVLLLLDGSASMYAEDASDPLGAATGPLSRFAAARGLAQALVDRLPRRFLVASYSGLATVHLPAVDDRELVREALATAEPHGFYRSTGSSLSGALDLVLEIAGEGVPDLQVVLLGDGELPFDEDYEEALAAVAARGVPVHAVTLGSEEGQTRLIYDLADVVAGKEPDERRVLREFTTRRVDRHFGRIAEATGGFFAAGASDGALAGLVEAVEAHRFAPGAGLGTGSDGAAASPPRELGGLLVALALALLVGERLLLARRPPGFDRAARGFDLGRIGRAAEAEARRGDSAAAAARTLVLSLLLVVLAPGGLSCAGGDAAERAHRENERGIARDVAGIGAAARAHYRRAASFGHRSEIPTYNLARSWTVDEEYGEAHRVYQQVIEESPELLEAFYNHGAALYGWGVAEEDPRGCELERTAELWRAAQGRFADVAARAEGPLAARARANRAFLGWQLALLERRIADPPPECGGASAATRAESEAPPSSEPPPSEPPPSEPPPSEPPPSEPPPSGSSPAQPPAGEPPPAEPSPTTAGGGGAPEGEGDAARGEELTPHELERIHAALERVREQGREEGKYHRRTRAEQFPEESWRRPDPEIWW